QVPVYPTIASQFNDPGVTWMFANLCRLLRNKIQGLGNAQCGFDPQVDTSIKEPRATVLIPGARVRYLAEIAEEGRAVNADIARMAEAATKAQHWFEALAELKDPCLPKTLDLYETCDIEEGAGARMVVDSDEENAFWEQGGGVDRSMVVLRQRYNEAVKELSAEAIRLLRDWPARKESVSADVNEYEVRGKKIAVQNYRESLSHQKIPKIAPPTTRDWGDLLKFLMMENLPGAYPYTGGVYPYRRSGEDP